MSTLGITLRTNSEVNYNGLRIGLIGLTGNQLSSEFGQTYKLL